MAKVYQFLELGNQFTRYARVAGEADKGINNTAVQKLIKNL